MIRIANGQGFWGDSLEAPLEQIRRGPIDYFGGRAMAEALGQGAQIVITGRCTDTGLVLGPMMHEFRWARDDWDKLASGTIAGHSVECGAQCTGGNCQVDWESIPDYA